jgi:phosphatidylglycerol---prolipoprotein diacylglyceryl transferase
MQFLSRFKQISDTRKLALFVLFFALISTAILFDPIAQIFAGNAKLEQLISISIPGWLPFLKNSIGSVIAIRFYSLCILVGVILGYCMTLFLAKRNYIAGTVIDRLLIGLVIFGLFGARILFVLVHFNDYKSELLSILYTWQVWLAYFGALIAGLGYIYIYCKRFGFNVFEFLDILTPGILIGQIFGRFGNFFNYESYGGPTSVYWKMYIPQTAKVSSNINQDFFHPTFLYEIIPNVLLLIFLLWGYDQFTNKKSGLVFARYAIGYGVIRFITEFYRTDALMVSVGGVQLMVSQLIAILFVVYGVYLLIARRKIVFNKRTLIEIHSANKSVSTI